MPNPSRRAVFCRALTLPVLIASLLWTHSAGAESSNTQSAENKAAARTLGVEGIKLANAGDCEAAVDRLTRAEALYHAPTILGRLGECQVLLGKLVEGTENLNRVVREQLPDDAPAAFFKARDRAQKVLDQALPKIAKLKIHIQPNVAGLEVRIGDKPVPLALLGADRPTDPGKHLIVAQAAGYLPASAEVTLPEGGQQNVSLTLVADPEAAEPAPPPVAPAPPAPQAQLVAVDTGVAQPDRTTAYLLLGVGGAGLIAGSIAGVLAMGKKGDLEDACESPSRCPASAQSDLDAANRRALISTIGFGIGIAGVAAGTILYLSGSSGDTAMPQFEVYGATARPCLGPAGAGLMGNF